MAKSVTNSAKIVINPSDYLKEGEAIPAYIDEDGEFHRRPGINIDPLLLYSRLGDIDKGALRVYFFLLSRLISNHKPIKVHSSTIKLATLKGMRRERFHQYKTQLIDQGLITCPELHTYYINPLFAWIGDSGSMFDPKYLPDRRTAE